MYRQRSNYRYNDIILVCHTYYVVKVVDQKQYDLSNGERLSTGHTTDEEIAIHTCFSVFLNSFPLSTLSYLVNFFLFAFYETQNSRTFRTFQGTGWFL